MKTLPCTALAVLVLASAGLMAQVQMGASLNGAQEVPPVPTPGAGLGWVTLNQPANTLTYRVVVTGLLGATTAAHFHAGAVGVPGGVVFGLVATSATSWEGTTPALTTAQVAQVLGGGWYLNVHTTAFGGGEIRGQVQTWVRRPLVASLNGGNEVPPVATAATGSATLWLNQPHNSVSYDVTAIGLAAVAAHIHTGAAGVPGPVLRGLNGGPTHWCGTTSPLTAAEVATVLAGGTYVNVHTAAHPGGEIRGQIGNAPAAHFMAFLNGAQEVPPVPSPATGFGQFVLNLATSTLAWNVSVSGLSSAVTNSHFHLAAQGTSGGVSLGVGAPTTPPSTWAGSAVLTAAQMDALFNQRLYFNVHTVNFPGGEVRGQIRPNVEPYGLGVDAAPGALRENDVIGPVTIGSTFSIVLRGAPAGDSATLFIAFSNASFLGIPLPFNFAPGAWLWIDADGALQLPTVTDAAGCAAFPIALPAATGLLGLTAHTQWLVVGPSGVSVSNANRITVQ